MRSILFTILLALSISSKADESCVYPSKSEEGVLSYFDKCGVIKGDQITLRKKYAEDVLFNGAGLACVMFSAEDVFYIQKNGRSQRTLFFDNGCDYFEKGLARGIVNEEMVFINEQLDIVLTPGFKRLSHFNYNHAVVCNGPFVEEKHGEHTLLKGGKCGLINKQGLLVVEAIYPIGDREVFQNYINTNNHCPPPPVASESAALCHAKRHIANIEHHIIEWLKHEISKQNDNWLITFTEERSPNDEFTLTLQSSNAQWTSLNKESHSKALTEATRKIP